MFTLIKKAKVYSPDPLGIKDILIAYGKIAAIEDNLNITGIKDLDIVKGEGLLVLPGFIDQHVHITGGGGEGGFETRTTEINAGDLFNNGITTVVGILGTDGVTRTVGNLYTKACELQQKGLTTFIYTGSYQVPPINLTGDIQKDLVFIDKVIGVGEIAISDHRSYNPSTEELERIAANARVGGMLTGKAGVVHLHMGDGESGLKPIFKVLDSTEIPAQQFVPSHINRCSHLFEDAMAFMDRGGYIDLTAGFKKEKGFMDCIPAYDALKLLIDSGKPIERVTISSDANGSAPAFDDNGNLQSIQVASCSVLLEDIKKAIFTNNLDISMVLKVITENPARLLKLDNKGKIEVGKDADLLITDEMLNIKKVHTKCFLK